MTRGSLADPRGAHRSSWEGTGGAEVFFGGHGKRLKSEFRVFPLTDDRGADS